MFAVSSYHYDLPADRIAQKPVRQRESSRLMVFERGSGVLRHAAFADIAQLLGTGDLLVINDTAVIPGRLFGRKASGGRVEVLLLDFAGACESCRPGSAFVCPCLVKASKPLKKGAQLLFEKDVTATVIDGGEGRYTLAFDCVGAFETYLQHIGSVPLPPYIKRRGGRSLPADRGAYQTVYAATPGAIAAPTAGLHFSIELLDRLRARGVEIVAITLHVGYGTFAPVRVSDIRHHRMHAERFHISNAAADRLNRARTQQKRIVAVGTTCVRVLEYAVDGHGRIASGSGQCDLFIYPGYDFRMVDAMITNFHLPRSTLLMLVAAFAGRQEVLAAYREAIDRGYRFYSYGDAMLIC